VLRHHFAQFRADGILLESSAWGGANEGTGRRWEPFLPASVIVLESAAIAHRTFAKQDQCLHSIL
jgi:hypothetical protein